MFKRAAADESDPDRPADDDAASPGAAEGELPGGLQGDPDEAGSAGVSEADAAGPADAGEPAAAEEPSAQGAAELPEGGAKPSASASGAQREDAPGADADEAREPMSAVQAHADEDEDDAVPFPPPVQAGPVMLDAITVQEDPQAETQAAAEGQEPGEDQDAPGEPGTPGELGAPGQQDVPGEQGIPGGPGEPGAPAGQGILRQVPEDREAEKREGDQTPPEQPAEDAREQVPRPAKPGRDAALGAATAEGLSTMTPVTRVREAPQRVLGEAVLSITGLSKQFGTELAVNEIDLQVRRGSFTGIVGPNGAGKTTTISMATGLLRPTSGTVEVLGIDVWQDATAARRHIGILPDRLRLFDQLTGAQLLYYTGVLRGLTAEEARSRTESLLHAFGLEADANRLVVDYSAGMTKKAALASALIHSPELLVLDEPFESIDPVSASQLTDILFEYVQRGGSVLLSSHSMDLVQRVCDHVAVIVRGEIVASGTVDEVRGDVTLEERFRDIVRGPDRTEGLDWLGISFS